MNLNVNTDKYDNSCNWIVNEIGLRNLCSRHTHTHTLDLFMKQRLLNTEPCIAERQLNRTAWGCQSLQQLTKASTIKANNVNVQKGTLLSKQIM